MKTAVIDATRRIGFCLLAAVLVLASRAAAQPAQPEGTWLQMTVTEVKPELLEDYIDLQKNQINPALQKAGVPWRSAWRTGEFGNTYERIFVTPINDFRELDGGGPLGRVLEPDRLERLLAKYRRCTNSRRIYALRHRPDLSSESDASELSIARLVAIQVAPGRAREWEQFLHDNLSRFRDRDVVFGVYERVLGPGPSVWHIVENLRSYALLDRPGIFTRAFGEVPAELAGLMLSVERTVLEYDPELSFEASSALTRNR